MNVGERVKLEMLSFRMTWAMVEDETKEPASRT